MDPVLIVENIYKKFRECQAVCGVSFEVHEGEILGILGPNGAGKSTILAIITGLVSPDKGTVRIFGFDLRTNHKEAKKNLGVLNERPGFYNHLSAIANLRLFSKFKNSTQEEVTNILDKVGLFGQRNKRVSTFSQGMRKRLGLANALIGNPKLLILDEPTNGLDPKGTKVILDLIKSLSIKKKLSAVISSNQLNDIESICNRVLLIDKGHVLFCESVQKLLQPVETIYLIKVKPLGKALSMLRKIDGVKSADYTDEGLISVVLLNLTPSELNRRLVNEGFDVCELYPARRTLQELFLQLKDQ